MCCQIFTQGLSVQVGGFLNKRRPASKNMQVWLPNIWTYYKKLAFPTPDTDEGNNPSECSTYFKTCHLLAYLEMITFFVFKTANFKWEYDKEIFQIYGLH